MGLAQAVPIAATALSRQSARVAHHETARAQIAAWPSRALPANARTAMRRLFRRRGNAEPTSPTPDAAPSSDKLGVNAPARPKSVLVAHTERLPAGVGLGIDLDQSATVRRPSPRQVAFAGAEVVDAGALVE